MPYTQEQRWDHERDHAKHDWRPGDPLPLNPTDQQIVEHLDYIERGIREGAKKSQTACAEAMQIIEKLMADLGVPMYREPTDAA